MKHLPSLLLLLSILPTALNGTIVVVGNGDVTTETFNAPVVITTFDPTIGSLYTGLGTGFTDTKTFAISRINRYLGNTTPHATGIANATSSPSLEGEPQRFLTTATADGVESFVLAGSIDNSNTVFAVLNTGATAIASAALIDATTGFTASGIAALAANNSFIYAAVKPSSSGTFGPTGSGIAVVRITKTPNLSEGSLLQTDAQTGGTMPQAQKLDQSSPQVKTASSVNNPTFENFATMHWDDTLQRLYIGLQLTTQTNAATDGIKSVVVAYNNPTNTDILNLSAIAPDSTVATTRDQIVVSQNNGTDPAVQLATLHLRTMHTSTGLSYLIVHGGNGDSSVVGNKVFALPLIDNPTDTANHGTLANKNILTNGVFQTVPTAPADIPTDFTISGNQSDIFALVGGTALFPLISPNAISDIVVIGDTVYASSNTAADTSNEAGIFYSQAMFDNTGKILRWTPWARAFSAQTGTENNPVASPVSFFSVDQVNGKLFAVTNDLDISDQTVLSNQWDLTSTGTSLTAELTDALPNGCYSALNLHAFTRGLGEENANRYALFGGAQKVVFARTSISQATAVPYNTISDPTTNFTVTAPQRIITDFSNPQDFLITQLPSDAGCVTCLAYSQRAATEGNQGYFFAGTARGLYVFASGNQGFDITTFGALNMPPFTQGTWQKVPQQSGTINDTLLFGSIVDIQTRGQQLYVITTTSTPQKPYLSTLWRIPYQNTVSAMFAPGNIIKIAETGTGIFANTSLFTGMQIIKTGAQGAEDAKEQLILTANTGLYKSNASQTGGNSIITAADQTAANWTAIDTSTLYSGIAGMNTALPATVWPISTEDPGDTGTYNRSSLNQISGNGNTAGTAALIGAFDPENFNNSENTLTTLPITAFWSDGARRFLILNRNNTLPSQSNIALLPFAMNVGDGYIPFDPALLITRTYYWTELIGATGILMAGTDNGVIALQ